MPDSVYKSAKRHNVGLLGEGNAPLKAWVTYQKKDGSERHKGTIATNPEYVEAHSEWLWQEITLPKAP